MRSSKTLPFNAVDTAGYTSHMGMYVNKNTWLNIYQVLPSTGDIGFEGILQNEV
ncbi:hypothetical protein H6G41_19810 [Tolypothrix sp. FACHB-123]|uniref:hypothetical protein n=1 Tax=Tolypothrix sp. FACHB-123 TaxID=2692868 RepID=UPI0016837437|nr:hypothetical protein [Tolypothrix sp. FACHB-123]MBD2356845.1 hypothetical protein [Tolypothrix sp. FACHB-123]